MFWRKMESTLVQSYFSLILIFTFCISLEQCRADDEVRPLEKFCNQPIDCGPNHVIAIYHVNRVKEFRSRVKNECNGKHKCQVDLRDKNCTIKYHCIMDHFFQNCSVMNVPESSETSSDTFWCYQRTKQEKGKNICWEFPEGFVHHWIVLRGTMKIKNDTDAYGRSITNFDLVTSLNESRVCTSSRYIWIIYIGSKSRDTPVNIFSKVDPTIPRVDPTEPKVDPTVPKVDPTVPRVVPATMKIDPTSTKLDPSTIKVDTTVSQGEKDFNKNSSGGERNKNATKDFQTDSHVDGKKSSDDDIFKDMNLTKIIIIISAIGGVLIVVAVTIAILWCCCRRCSKVTINKPDPEQRKNSYMEKDVKDAKSEDPDCQIREGFIPVDGMRDTFDSVGFWSDEDDYDPEVGDRNSKIANIYAMSDCLYARKHSKNEIYMNTGVPPPPPPSHFGNEKDVYINMNAKPVNKHFNVFL